MRPFGDTAFYKRTGARPVELKMDGLLPLPDGWDGTVLIPARAAADLDEPARLLTEAIASCRERLAGLSLDIAADCLLGANHYGIIPERGRVAWFPGRPDALVPVHFDLGGANAGRSTDEMRAEQVAHGGPAKLLEPATALLILTEYLGHLGRARPTIAIPILLVECAGVRYSPNGNGKFDDVPRWDVYPPVGTSRGLVFLNWNWSRRSRPAQGIALAMDAKP